MNSSDTNGSTPGASDTGGLESARDSINRDGDVGSAASASPSHREASHPRTELGPHGDTDADRKAPVSQPLLLVGWAVTLVAFAWIMIGGLASPPQLVAQPANELADARLKTARTTPAAATALSDSFVPADADLRARVLQRLASFRSKWRIEAPVVAIHAYDVRGDGVELAEQFESWLDHHNLVTMNSATGRDSGVGEISDTDLPAPSAKGLLLRFNEEDAAIAGDLAIAMAPAIGGEVSLLSDARVEEQRIVIAIVGAPAFGEDGVAFFPE